VKLESLPQGVRLAVKAAQEKKAAVDGVEGAAKNRNMTRMMLCGGAVRLRCGQ